MTIMQVAAFGGGFKPIYLIGRFFENDLTDQPANDDILIDDAGAFLYVNHSTSGVTVSNVRDSVTQSPYTQRFQEPSPKSKSAWTITGITGTIGPFVQYSESPGSTGEETAIFHVRNASTHLGSGGDIGNSISYTAPRAFAKPGIGLAIVSTDGGSGGVPSSPWTLLLEDGDPTTTEPKVAAYGQLFDAGQTGGFSATSSRELVMACIFLEQE